MLNSKCLEDVLPISSSTKKQKRYQHLCESVFFCKDLNLEILRFLWVSEISHSIPRVCKVFQSFISAPNNRPFFVGLITREFGQSFMNDQSQQLQNKSIPQIITLFYTELPQLFKINFVKCRIGLKLMGCCTYAEYTEIMNHFESIQLLNQLCAKYASSLTINPRFITHRLQSIENRDKQLSLRNKIFSVPIYGTMNVCWKISKNDNAINFLYCTIRSIAEKPKHRTNDDFELATVYAYVKPILRYAMDTYGIGETISYFTENCSDLTDARVSLSNYCQSKVWIINVLMEGYSLDETQLYLWLASLINGLVRYTRKSIIGHRDLQPKTIIESRECESMLETMGNLLDTIENKSAKIYPKTLIWDHLKVCRAFDERVSNWIDVTLRWSQ